MLQEDLSKPYEPGCTRNGEGEEKLLLESKPEEFSQKQSLQSCRMREDTNLVNGHLDRPRSENYHALDNLTDTEINTRDSIAKDKDLEDESKCADVPQRTRMASTLRRHSIAPRQQEMGALLANNQHALQVANYLKSEASE